MESESFSVSLGKIITAIILSESLKEGEKPRTRAAKIRPLVTPCILQHKGQCAALKEQSTKKSQEEAAECANLSAKRVKEAKEKHPEQIVKRRGLSSPRASPSKLSPVKNKSAEEQINGPTLKKRERERNTQRVILI